MDISNGEGLGVSLFVQGCDFHCKNCFNKETWDFEGGEEFTFGVFVKLINYLNNPHIKRLSILGGEPLHYKNFNQVKKICEVVKSIFPDIKIWVYTGCKFENILKDVRYCGILSYIDVLVDGEYVDELKDFNYKWAGSTNQRVIDAPKSFMNERMILYESKE